MNRTLIVTFASATAATISAAMLLSGCSSAQPPSMPIAAASVFDHIHEIVIDEGDGTLLVATHEGLYQLTISPDGSAASVGPIGGLDFDPMGFTVVGGTAYASGHPGPATPDTFGSPNLGLITSNDLGETWTNVSLTGVTDFHGLTVASNGGGNPTIFGYDWSTGRVQLSLDGGVTWSDGASVLARDILAVGDRLFATTEDGLAVSSDNGMSFTIDETAPPLYVLAADEAGTMAGVDTAGILWTRATGGGWQQGKTVTGAPQAFAVEGDRMYVADDRGIAFTDDAGETWTVLTIHA